MILTVRLKAIFLTVFLFLFLSAEAQRISQVSRTMYREAEEFMLEGEYKEALPLYLLLCQKGFTTANIHFKIGECYLNIPGQKDKALPYLEKAVQNVSPAFSGKDLSEKNAPLVSHLYLGIAYRNNYQFEKAMDAFRTMLAAVDTSDDQVRMILEHHMERCQHAEDMMQSPAKVKKDRLPGIINDGLSNYNPLLSRDESRILYMNHYKLYDAIMQSVKSDDVWQEPENLTPVVRSDGDHYITGLSADGNILLLTAYDPYHSGEIYSCLYNNGEWTPITKLNSFINTRFNETHASLSPDGQTLYFTSDRKGGIGGLDIYRSEMTGSDWGPPVNLGPVINTIFDEETPFLTPDGKKLFFSSQGHYNMGGFDVFYSEKGNGEWSSPVNLGYPVNTPDDELFWFPVDSGMHAYMPVVDNETRQYDIFRFVFTKNANPARYVLAGKLEPLPENEVITVSFIDKDNRDTLASQELDREGRFRQKLPQGNYTLTFSDNTGKPLETREMNIPPNFPQNELVLNTRILPADSVQTVPGSRETTTVQVAGSVEKILASDTLWLEYILFPFDRSDLPASSLTCLNTLADLLVRFPSTLLKITGYTDAIGNEDYNLKLSLDRAKAVALYLQKKQVDPSRLSVDGLGEALPVAVNANPDGSDSPAGRSFNRRVELKVSFLPENWVIVEKDIIPPSLKAR